MKLTYYGTAAGEGFPGLFCHCPLCMEARRLGGKNIRTRSQALINEDLLLDLPPDTYLHSLYCGLDLSRINAVLITHSHSDHFYPHDLELLRDPYSLTRATRVKVFGNEAVRAGLLAALGTTGGEKERFEFCLLQPGDTVSVNGYEVLALRATHTKGEPCLFYRIRKDGSSVLYAHDTGAFTEENLAALSDTDKPLDLVSLDCTAAKYRDGGYHMGLPDDLEQKAILLERGLADEHTVFVCNHVSHNGGWLHKDLEEHAAEHGFLTSYDGMQLEF